MPKEPTCAKNPYYRLSLNNRSHNQELIDEYVATLPLMEGMRVLTILYDVFDIIDTGEIILATIDDTISYASEFGLWLLKH